MPRITTMQFTKDYQTVAEAFKTMVKNAIVTEREEDGHAIIDIEGDFKHFVLEDMDMWGGYFKFEIKDNRSKNEDDREARSIMANAMPQLASTLYSTTIGYVYRRTRYKTCTQTVVEKVYEDGRIPVVMSREGQETDWQNEWENITLEFGKKVRIDR